MLAKRLMSVCEKEGIKVQGNQVLEKLCEAANGDVRSVLNSLQMYALGKSELCYDDASSTVMEGKIKSSMQASIFDKASAVLNSRNKSDHISDKMERFFFDFSLMPLFVQENYVHNKGFGKDDVDTLNKVATAADEIALGDVIGTCIQRDQRWGLMPLQSLVSCVLPGSHVSGYPANFPTFTFPKWLGSNSSAGAKRRRLEEVARHVTVGTSNPTTIDDVALHYLPVLKERIISPLMQQQKDGIDGVIGFMDEYYMSKETMESIIEIGQFSTGKDIYKDVDSQVKAAFTRAFNKMSHKGAAGVAKDEGIGRKKKVKVFEDAVVNPDDLQADDPESSDDEDVAHSTTALTPKAGPKATSKTAAKPARGQGRGSGSQKRK
jgi:replication factor C subunit 1